MAFEATLDAALAKHERCRPSVDNAIADLAENPKQGDAYPGFGSLSVRKTRLPMKEYNIGKSKGLRLIFLVHEEKSAVLPIIIYRKNQFPNEKEVLKAIKRALTAILQEISE